MRVLWVAVAIVVLDQLTKVAVKLTMYPYESIPIVGRLFRFTFTENPGMAFGMTVGSKLFLTLFSIVATGLIGAYLWHVRRGPYGYRLALALILGGALGNIIDRTFYGLIWGYAPLFYGNVVDFLHVDLWQGVVPESVPLLGGRFIALFPIGNIADVAIVGGVVAILLFQGRFQREIDAAEAARAADAQAAAERAAMPEPAFPGPGLPEGGAYGPAYPAPPPTVTPPTATAPTATAPPVAAPAPPETDGEPR